MKQDHRTGTPPSVTSDSVPHLVDVPAFCQFYGHSWESTARPGVKRCYLCGVRGYCPGCTPLPLKNAKPFCCTRHAAQAESAVHHG